MIDYSFGVVDGELDQWWYAFTHLSSLETPGVFQDLWRSWFILLNSTLGVSSTLITSDDHCRQKNVSHRPPLVCTTS